VTDADIVLGRIDPAQFAGGQVPLEPARAAQAIAETIGEPLGLGIELAAYSVGEMVDETMANAARVHAVERGKVASEHSLIAFGGAAPLHVARLAEKLGISRIVVPCDAGVGSAVGFLRAPVSYEVVKSRNMRLSDFDAALANTVLEEMWVEAHAVVEGAAPGTAFEEERGAFMRYVGQGHEVFVPLPARQLTDDDSATLRSSYDTVYQRLFGRVINDAEVEILTWLLRLSSANERPTPSPAPPEQQQPLVNSMRSIVDPATGEPIGVPVYSRMELARGAVISGPGLIVEDQTTTFIPDRFAARISSAGHIVMEIQVEASQ
jgi:N-methylhydantoinase A